MTQLEKDATTQILRNGSCIIITLPLSAQPNFNSIYSGDVQTLNKKYSSVVVLFTDKPNIQLFVSSI